MKSERLESTGQVHNTRFWKDIIRIEKAFGCKASGMRSVGMFFIIVPRRILAILGALWHLMAIMAVRLFKVHGYVTNLNATDGHHLGTRAEFLELVLSHTTGLPPV